MFDRFYGIYAFITLSKMRYLSWALVEIISCTHLCLLTGGPGVLPRNGQSTQLNVSDGCLPYFQGPRGLPRMGEMVYQARLACQQG